MAANDSLGGTNESVVATAVVSNFVERVPFAGYIIVAAMKKYAPGSWQAFS